MIKKPQGYDESWAATGEVQQLPAGLYVCSIVQVTETQTKNGDPQIAILFDVAEGEHKGFYKAQYEASRGQENAKWKGVHRQRMTGTGLPHFKGIITSIEKSNPGFSFQFDKEGNEKTLVGKKFGAVMGREQFRAQDGSLKFSTKIFQIRSLEGLKEAEVPADKLLDDANKGEPVTGIPYLGKPDANGFMNIPDGMDEELPFN